MSLKAETEMAMKLLEKDIHEKQDTIVSLRRQLDDIKQINLEMYRKLQVRLQLSFRLGFQFLSTKFSLNVLSSPKIVVSIVKEFDYVNN